MWKLVVTALAIALVAAVDGVATQAGDGSGPVVQIGNGKVQGQAETVDGGTTVYSFKGIPFAADTSGANRWRAPQEREAWEGTLDGTKFGDACPQVSDQTPEGTDESDGSAVLAAFASGNSDNRSMSEDCLNLNVYSPDLTRSLPVMVWIHGGSLRTGSGQDYNPSLLVERDVVVVTINYRLDYLGFFAHPSLNETNFGMLDQIKALEWVQSNIASFGGNPDQVTIFGESAGGGSVMSLLVSPLAREGLFHGAIVESSGFGLESNNETLQEAAPLGVAVGEAVGIAAGPDQLEAMRSVIPQDLFTTGEGVDNLYYYIDGVSLDSSIFEGFTVGLNENEHANVPLLIGTNAMEDSLFDAIIPDYKGLNTAAFYSVNVYGPIDTTEKYEQLINGAFGEMAPAVLDLYPAKKDDDVKDTFLRLLTDLDFGAPTYFAAKAVSDRGGDVYLYHFDSPLKGAGAELGAFHALELLYLFDYGEDVREFINVDLQEDMISYWTNFAKTGDPNTSGDDSEDDENDLPEWNALSVVDFDWNVLGQKGPDPGEIPESMVEKYTLLYPFVWEYIFRTKSG